MIVAPVSILTAMPKTSAMSLNPEFLDRQPICSGKGTETARRKFFDIGFKMIFNPLDL